MDCSEARLAANRRNAQRSTGPKTPEGKSRSRANALKHGLCSSVVVAEDPALVKERTEDYFYSLKPQNEYQTWVVGQIALVSIRVDRAQRIERRVRDKVALRAELTWEDDRRLEAEVLGGLLARKPTETVETLRRTPQGCEWLMTRWALLAHAAETQPGGWTEGQTSLAFDLLATPELFRTEGRKPGTRIDFEGNVLDDGLPPAAIARREVAELKQRREVVEGLDDVERTLTESDLTNEQDPELRRLRRYESSLHQRLRWCVGQLPKPNPLDRPIHDLRPRFREEDFPPQPKPEAAPRPEPQHLKVEDEVAVEASPAAERHEAPVDRKEKRLDKVEARRQSKQRKDRETSSLNKRPDIDLGNDRRPDRPRASTYQA